MAITATVPQSANYAPKSNMAEGLNPAVIFHVEDLGLVPKSEFIVAKERAQRVKEGSDPNRVKTSVPKARVFFNNAAGEIIAKDYNLSLHEKADLSKDLKRMGKTFDQTFDVETLTSTQVQLMTEEAVSQKGNKYIKIATIAKPHKGQNVKALPVSAAKQDVTNGTSAKRAPQANLEVTDEDIPF
jgi:hypothetical protein